MIKLISKNKLLIICIIIGATLGVLINWIVGIIIGLILIGWHQMWLEGGDKNKKCSWCSTYIRNMKFIEGRQGKWYWDKENKDGSKDKRIKDNYQIAQYFSLYECNKCNAQTAFGHLYSANPGKNVKVLGRKLEKKGIGERLGSDWKE